MIFATFDDLQDVHRILWAGDILKEITHAPSQRAFSKRLQKLLDRKEVLMPLPNNGVKKKNGRDALVLALAWVSNLIEKIRNAKCKVSSEEGKP